MIGFLFTLFIFPGALFLLIFGLAAQYLDRKVHARLQNRVGPPWFQPLADLIKLFAKEELIPLSANPRMFKAAPLFALAAVISAYFYLPLWHKESLYSFNGDILVVLYLLTIPTLAFFIGGWYSTSLYARIGSARCLTQLFAYEVPLFMGILSAALLANTWSLTEMAVFYQSHNWLWLVNIPALAISMIALLGKLEKVPFDIPEAETEIVAGSFTEYSGRLFAILRITLDIELVVGASLIACVFLPFGLSYSPAAVFGIYLLKVIFIILLLSLLRTIFARLRLDQMIEFCWKYLVPVGLLQLLLNLIIKGVVLQ